MPLISAKSGKDLQAQLAKAVAMQKQVDPFKSITFLVDGHHQAIQFRRQLISKVAATTNLKTLLSVKSFTRLDLLNEIVAIAKLDWTFESYKSIRNEELHRKLKNSNNELSSFADNLQNFQAVITYLDSLDWIDLPGHVDSINWNDDRITSLSKKLLKLAIEVHRDLPTLGARTPNDVLKMASSSMDGDQRKKLLNVIGASFRVSESFPEILMKFISGLQMAEDHFVLRIDKPDQDDAQSSAELFSFPDPNSEAQNAANIVAHELSNGTPANRIAILYSDAAEYSQHIGNALDSADICWHGFAVETPRASATGRAFKALIESYRNFVATGNIQRVKLLSLIRSGRFDHVSIPFDNFKADYFIRGNSFYGGITEWLPLLATMYSNLDVLRKNLAEEEQYGDEESQKSAARAVTDAETAGSMQAMILFIADSFRSISKNKDLSGVGSTLAKMFSELFSDKAFPRTPADLLVSGKLLTALNTLPKTSGSAIELAEQISSSADTLLSRLKLQNGEMSKGVYVGPVSQNGGLEFDVVIVLGCAEGIFPPSMSENPLLPDLVKSSVSNLGTELPTIFDRVDQLERHCLAITRDTRRTVLSQARGGYVGSSSGESSRFIRKFSISSFTDVAGTDKLRLLGHQPASRSTISLRSKLENIETSHGEVSQTTSAALAFALPALDDHFGLLESTIHGRVIDFSNTTLSASAVEKFLKCGHYFFSTKILGFSDQDEPDEILNVQAKDKGKIVHAALERLLVEHTELTPTFGQPYSDAAREKFIELLNEEAAKAKEKGLAGWLPYFNDFISKYEEAVDEIFTLEHGMRVNPGQIKGKPRDSDAMAPAQAEFGWHQNSGKPFELEVETTSGRKTNMKFSGYIDRLNRAENNSTLGVVDFKTGNIAVLSPEKYVQDLLYAAAIKAKTPFLGIPVTKVSSLYLQLKLGDKFSIRDLRSNINKDFSGVWLDPSDGGLTGSEYAEALKELSSRYEIELNTQLSKLLVADENGSFIPKKSQYCATCKLLGSRVVERLEALVSTTENADASDEE
jgi:hypothetical protein